MRIKIIHDRIVVLRIFIESRDRFREWRHSIDHLQSRSRARRGRTHFSRTYYELLRAVITSSQDASRRCECILTKREKWKVPR